ncbi:MAG: undecaprenyldiphospho-muramoylpentapeptide beta-N-acetylglucosaminyltransferase [Nitrospina sp.]|nr:undecaprenyldiphospho-muramoylpentapeptide beta-N-acetylglucosaminyltransferase [Nitrospina sp.]
MTRKVLIAGGGTGGHLFPGIALAKALRKSDMTIEILFVGTKKGIESKVLPKEGFRLKTIISAGLLGKKGLDKWISLLKLMVGGVQSIGFLICNRPNLVVGVGGYVSAPLVFSAWLLRIPTLIHEQNSFPGMANKLLGKIADKVAVSYEESKKFFSKEKVDVTGNMIDEKLCQSKEKFSPTSKKPFGILVLGGSQGAHSINMAMIEALDLLSERKDNLYITHQTGDADYENVKKKYSEKGFSSNVMPFITDMPERYRLASLIICRSGATTLAEVTAVGKVSTLIPFPYAANNHQEHNARVMKTANAGEIILDKEICGDRLAKSIKKAMDEPETLMMMENNSYRLGIRDGSEKVRKICLELMSKEKKKDNNNELKNKHVLSCF